ncbi:hypothetical protein MtrunA17_Chr6g0449591 [Medicago truncatula]|uniref:Transmembrane protein n=1 Tax=Medicago truncatula TaxID=3880 RepID=A0A396HFP0_MEDTR|nr:hypothetical protein MtrunA17_Chr6g0449591 [Medicago truncatula]
MKPARKHPNKLSCLVLDATAIAWHTQVCTKTSTHIALSWRWFLPRVLLSLLLTFGAVIILGLLCCKQLLSRILHPVTNLLGITPMLIPYTVISVLPYGPDKHKDMDCD